MTRSSSRPASYPEFVSRLRTDQAHAPSSGLGVPSRWRQWRRGLAPGSEAARSGARHILRNTRRREVIAATSLCSPGGGATSGAGARHGAGGRPGGLTTEAGWVAAVSERASARGEQAESTRSLGCRASLATVASSCLACASLRPARS